MNIFLKPHEAILGKGETPFGRNVTIYAWCVCCGLGDTFLDKEIPCYVTTLKLSETFFLSNVDNATCFTISHNLPNGFYFEDNRFSLSHSITFYYTHHRMYKEKLFVSCSFYHWKLEVCNKITIQKYPIENKNPFTINYTSLKHRIVFIICCI